jgi:hypothetical protein
LATLSPGAGSGGTVTNNYTSSPTDYLSTEFPSAKTGLMFLASSGLLSLSLAGNLRMTIGNPSGSGVTMYIRQIDLFSSLTTPGYVHIWTGTITNPAATAARPMTCTNIGGTSNAIPVAVIKADLVSQLAGTPLSGSVDTGLDIGYGGGLASQVVFPPIILHAGQTLGIASSIALSTNISIVARWIEQSGS